jgi:hypothetical protein
MRKHKHTQKRYGEIERKFGYITYMIDIYGEIELVPWIHNISV